MKMIGMPLFVFILFFGINISILPSTTAAVTNEKNSISVPALIAKEKKPDITKPCEDIYLAEGGEKKSTLPVDDKKNADENRDKEAVIRKDNLLAEKSEENNLI